MAAKSGWRLAVIFMPVVIGACWMLLLDTARALLRDIHRASYSILLAMIEWAGDPDKGDPNAR